MIESICETLADGLFAPDCMLAPEIAIGWLAGHLPTREYTRAYAPPAPLIFERRVKHEIKAKDKETTGKVKFFDVLEHITSGDTTTSSSTRPDGVHTQVTTDVGADTFAQLQDACHRSVPLAIELLTDHIFGASPPQPTLIDSLCRLFDVLMFEPIRFCFALEFTRPITKDIELALRRGIETQDSDAADRILQTHLVSFTLNWFSDVVELGVSHRFLNVNLLQTCRDLCSSSLFDTNIDALGARFTNFKYNGRIAKRLSRGRLIGAFCRTFVHTRGAESASFTREVCIAAIDRTLVRSLATVSNGSPFSTRDSVVAACAEARSALCALDIADVQSDAAGSTPRALMEQVAAAIRSRY